MFEKPWKAPYNSPGNIASSFSIHLTNHTLSVFAYYRFALAAVVAIVLLSSGA